MTWKPNRTEKRTLFDQIRAWIVEQIEDGHWSNGMRLPSQRKLAEQFGVNRSTIIQVLDELKAEDVIESRQGSGVYVKPRGWDFVLRQQTLDWHQRIKQSAYKVNAQTIQLINEYEALPTTVRLGTGELSPELIPQTALLKSFSELTLTNQELGYSEPLGSLHLRNTLTSYLERRGIVTKPNNILIVSGAVQALQLLSLGLLETGTSITTEAASYIHSIPSIPSVSFQASNKKTMYYTIPTLSNPTGKILTLEERKRLVERCSVNHMPVVEDDVYSELTFDGAPPALKSFDRAGQVLYIGSVSKCISPGIRVGWLVGPESVVRYLADLKMQLDYGTSAISQQLVAQWLNSSYFYEHIYNLRASLKKRADFTEAILQKTVGDIAEWESSKGGFYIWLRIKQPVVTKSLFLALLKQNILINPGYIYKPNDYHYVRVSYAYCTLDELKRGLIMLANEVKKRFI
ncbi:MULTISPECIES: PLP-dependent aminotransferase family protein [Shouchella]|uniref:PLP-dependent aminotransferase family protein n=3 Tax=Shouchella TaxID=2893057 RepID=A0A4Y7WJQ1_9BACI|nr:MULTISPECIES: PLP-dependent aminotransferase family protein [Shouchella]MBG9785987.1 GntR family transcriptional regulator [Shouchella lehensis]MED4130578.1 PLP-dependent aminotransferase family protein [Shouchella miscanthi]TES48466.1 PLP-dependent aminotransferase family protein [Shouchella lehensis]WDF03368.1 PLP-dependent aminotransferase family protein [Shouchella hunanensis]